MDVAIGDRWQPFVESQVGSGRYGSVSELLGEGLRLVEEREAKLAALRLSIEEAIAEGGGYTEEEVREYLEPTFRQLEADGY